jgi:hypothetical protein
MVPVFLELLPGIEDVVAVLLDAAAQFLPPFRSGGGHLLFQVVYFILPFPETGFYAVYEILLFGHGMPPEGVVHGNAGEKRRRDPGRKIYLY